MVDCHALLRNARNDYVVLLYKAYNDKQCVYLLNLDKFKFYIRNRKMKQTKIIKLLATLYLFTGIANAAGEFVTCQLYNNSNKGLAVIGWLFYDGALIATAPKKYFNMKVTSKVLGHADPIEIDSKGQEVVENIKNQRVKMLTLIHEDSTKQPVMHINIALNAETGGYDALGHVANVEIDENAACTYTNLKDSEIKTVLDGYKRQLDNINAKYPE
jgi:hypothetical protein